MDNLEEKVLNLSDEELKELANEGRRRYAREYRKKNKEKIKRLADLHFAIKVLSETEESK